MDRGGIIVGKKQVLGIALHEWTGEGIRLSHVHLHQRGNRVHVRDQGDTGSLTALVKKYGTRIPISLVIDTARCVHRVIDPVGEPTSILQQAFPNAPLDQLATSIWRTDNRAGVSMARRDMVKGILHQFSSHGLRVVRSAIGPWGLLGLRSLLNSEGSEWRMAGHTFTFTDGTLTGHVICQEDTEATFTLDTEEVNGSHAMALMAAWEKLSPPNERHDVDLPEIVLAKKEERARLWYEHGLLIGCAIIGLLIGGERFAAHRLDLVQQDLKTATHDQAKDMEATKELEARMVTMEKLGQLIGTQGGDGLALHAARIISTVPAGIRLDGLAVDPLLNLPKEREKLTVETGLIRIQGTCANAGLLDQWTATLRGLRDGPTVRLLSYTVDPEDNLPHFELQLGP
jgi:hypothetical protein